jgi:transposase InsO family protein
MPWGSAVDRRLEFVRLAQAPGANRSELCRRFGVSRSNGYKWHGRYQAEGLNGLEERSRRPHSSPDRTPPEIEARVLAMRAEHPAWGGRKIHRVLKDEGLAEAPAPSTITAILRRGGVLNGPGADEPRDWTRFEREAPNELWQMDFKGHFALERGRCHPLTVLDDHSRYALEIGACANEQARTVRQRLEQVFRRYGLPRRMLSDNGSPWGTSGRGRDPYTALAVWLLDLDVSLGHGKAYHPQTQGKIERFHRSLKAEVLAGRTFESLAEVQAALDAWRQVYNTKRPHEGIGLVTPDTRYRMSARSLPERIEPPEYEPQAIVRKVQAEGKIHFRGKVFNWSRAFVGRAVALRATEVDGVFDLCYRRHVLGQVDLAQNIVKSVHHVPEQVSTLSPV